MLFWFYNLLVLKFSVLDFSVVNSQFCNSEFRIDTNLARWQNDLPVLYSVDALFVLTVQALIFPSASPTMRGPWRGQHIHVTDEGWMNLLQITFLVSPQSSPTCNNAIVLRQN